MADQRSVQELKEAGACRPAPGAIVSLYHRAYREYGIQALWNRKPSEHPTITQALVVAEALRHEGDLRARPLAVQIEQACRGALCLS